MNFKKDKLTQCEHNALQFGRRKFNTDYNKYLYCQITNICTVR
uniref:Uncharacterized protein n=1 Tax=viral metagenome TaxID=1070528 RepID=A0A6C0C4Q2_9ZZZZ